MRNLNINNTVIINNNTYERNSTSHPTVEGSGRAKTKQLPPTFFNKVVLEGAMDIDIKIGDTTSIELTADDNLIDLIDIKAKASTLIVGFTQNSSFSSITPITVKLTTPSLTAVEIKGTGDISVDGLNEDNFNAVVMGCGDIYLSGKSHAASFEIMGNGDITASALTVNSLVARVMGNGDMEVVAIESLDAKVMGNGDIDVINTPKSVVTSSLGNGDINIKR